MKNVAIIGGLGMILTAALTNTSNSKIVEVRTQKNIPLVPHQKETFTPTDHSGLDRRTRRKLKL